MCQCFYSVPLRYSGRRLDVRLGAERIEALDGKKIVADHARAVGKGIQVLLALASPARLTACVLTRG